MDAHIEKILKYTQKNCRTRTFCRRLRTAIFIRVHILQESMVAPDAEGTVFYLSIIKK